MTRHAISTAVGTFLLAILLTACTDGGTTKPNPPTETDPVETPTTPADPSDPGDPEDPEEPTDPTDPTDPTEPESPLPPNPEDVAPPLTRADVTLKDQTAFLYTGPNPIQTGVAEGTITETRAAVIRGRVLNRDDQPLPGVKITIKGHDAFGQTLSRADGQFDMAVNGGGLLTINYEKAGYLPVQRQVRPQWNDYAFADDIVMIQLDPEVTTVQLGNGQPMQVAQGSPQTDADGTRQANILFPTNTTATMTLPDGSTQALTTLNVRATEYTVGDNGFEVMPGELPPTSAYTYAVELSVDEAMAAGSNRVDFNQPVPLYVDNFLDFPTGEIVPAGYYDYDDAVWKAGDNGRVIEILSIEDGLAILDLEGEGQAATIEELQALGIDEEEQQKLATLYTAGKTLWRTPISHFTPWDCNWPYVPPEDAVSPSVRTPETNNSNQPENSDEENECPGCVISPQRQTLGESLPVAGTSFELVYRSDRTSGYKNDVASIYVSGESVPSSLERIRLDIYIAGRRITKDFSNAPNQRYRFEWDGLDGYGRELRGSHIAYISLHYFYPCVYARADIRVRRQAWGYFSNDFVAIGNRYNCSSMVFTKKYQTMLNSSIVDQPRPHSIGSWSLDVHHLNEGALHLGTGKVQTNSGAGIETVAGKGYSGFPGDGSNKATETNLHRPEGVVVDAAGNFYFADSVYHHIRRVSPDGTIDTVAGSNADEEVFGFSGDGGPAKQALLYRPQGLAIDAAGNLYVADTSNYRVRRISPSGIIDTVAGGRESESGGGFSGDGGPATQAKLLAPSDVAVDSAGYLYIADSSRIRRVSPDGVIDTIVGNGDWGFFGDGGPATQAGLSTAAVAVDDAGYIYIADPTNNRIRRVNPSGKIETVVGNGNLGAAGDGGLAINAELNNPRGIAVDAGGNLYIADAGNYCSCPR
ncbi:MAG: SMP-30/gluconolactonase/LRE family protein [Saccharospirillum sp.]|nr:SMP-30/gluconolactonase/LRE family protein [Saccharospirillum sp.]